MKHGHKILAITGVAFLLAGCHTDMWIQPKTKPLQASEFFPDKSASRTLVEGTVSQEQHQGSDALLTGRQNGKLVTEIPIPIDAQALERGRERFEIFCSHCHGRLGDGKGMIAQRGLALRKPPASYHTDRLRQMPIGHFFDVITNGYGTMFNQAANIEPDDRWKIAAYIRALQISQNAKMDDVPADMRDKIVDGIPNPPQPAQEEAAPEAK